MRIWIGYEQEGREQGMQTLFVESRIITSKKIDLIKYYAKQTSIKRIYLGAGKKDILCCLTNLKQLKENENKIVYECSRIRKQKWLLDINEIILRQDVNFQEIKKLQSKIDNGLIVKMYEKEIYNDINVKNGTYKEDIVIWGK